jgi:hypothetical protein
VLLGPGEPDPPVGLAHLQRTQQRDPHRAITAPPCRPHGGLPPAAGRGGPPSSSASYQPEASVPLHRCQEQTTQAPTANPAFAVTRWPSPCYSSLPQRPPLPGTPTPASGLFTLPLNPRGAGLVGEEVVSRGEGQPTQVLASQRCSLRCEGHTPVQESA